MLRRPLIIGAGGGMGKRYGAILKYLGIDFIPVDVGDGVPAKGRYDSVIIATPTYMHPQHVRRFYDGGVPILCEKPLSTDLMEVLELCRDAEADGVKLRLVNQYAELVPEGAFGDTRYDYFRHGSDGLAWDCINILGLAKAGAVLAEHSPAWTCTINGQTLNLADMDGAYIKMIQSWLVGDHQNIDYIRHAHTAVSEYLSQRPY